MPLGSEQTEPTAEWLFSSEALADPTANIDNIVAFGRQVLEEDADICEINQKGLRSMRPQDRMLMPEEYELHRFHNWCASGIQRFHQDSDDQSDFGRYRQVTKPQPAASRPSVANTEPSPKNASTTE